MDRYCQKLFHNKKCIYVNYANIWITCIDPSYDEFKTKKTFISGWQTNKSIKRGLNNGSDMPFLIEFEITIFFFYQNQYHQNLRQFYTLYNQSHGKLKSRMLYDIIDNCF